MQEPIITWIRQNHVDRRVSCHFNPRRSQLVLMVWEGACLRGMGYGASLEEASADAMNDLMRKAYQNERDLDACDTAFEAERTPTERPPGS